TSIAKPTIATVSDDVGSVTGSIANNGTTDDNKPTLSGKAEAGSTVTIKNGSTVLGSAVADASGNWTFTPSTALANGKYTFTVVATNTIGLSSVSDEYSIKVDADRPCYLVDDQGHWLEQETVNDSTLRLAFDVDNIPAGAVWIDIYVDTLPGIRIPVSAANTMVDLPWLADGDHSIMAAFKNANGAYLEKNYLYSLYITVKTGTTFGAELPHDANDSANNFNLLLTDDDKLNAVVEPYPQAVLAGKVELDAMQVANEFAAISKLGDVLLLEGETSIDVDSLVIQVTDAQKDDFSKEVDSGVNLSPDSVHGDDANTIELLTLSEELAKVDSTHVDGVVPQLYAPGSADLLLETSILVDHS
ncbi:Ig-like domain-containing protein, partial [Aeromonas hydrophila]